MINDKNKLRQKAYLINIVSFTAIVYYGPDETSSAGIYWNTVC